MAITKIPGVTEAGADHFRNGDNCRRSRGCGVGYYNHCSRKQHDDGSCTWEISNSKTGASLPPPDARVGFPWTVKDWDKFWSKQTK